MGQQTQTLTAANNRDIDLAHQEVQRMIEELDNVYSMSQSEWLAAEPISNFLCTVLGYEDVNELEDALHGTFPQFLSMLPTVETKMVTPSSNDEVTESQLYFRVIPDPDKCLWVPKKLTYLVTRPAQLWNVLLKSAHARIEIPALGLEFSVDGRRRIDTVWNYLSQAALDLGVHIQHNKGFSDNDTDNTATVIEGLAALRDVDYEWELVVIDPSGTSKFTDMSLVQVEDGYVDDVRMVDQP